MAVAYAGGGGSLPALARLRARMLALNTQRVAVGVPAGKVEADGTSMALVARMTEFGNERVGSQERPFLRTGIKRAEPGVVTLNRQLLPRVIDGRISVGNALELIGEFAAGEVKRNMVIGPWAPNKPSTIARKGSSKPTIDSGALRQAVTHRVEAA